MTSQPSSAGSTPVKVTTNRGDAEEKKEETSETAVSKIANGVLDARKSLAKILMNHRFKQRFRSTAFSLDSSINGGVVLQDGELVQRKDMIGSNGVQPSTNVIIEEEASTQEAETTEIPSITPQEREYLEALIVEGDLAAMEAARDRLSDPTLFPTDTMMVVKRPEQEQEGDEASLKPPHSPVPMKKPLKRRDSKMQQQLFLIHQEKPVQPNKSLRNIKETRNGSLKSSSQSKHQTASSSQAPKYQFMNSLLQSFVEDAPERKSNLLAEDKEVEDLKKQLLSSAERFRSEAVPLQTSNSLLTASSGIEEPKSPVNKGLSGAARFRSEAVPFLSSNSLLMSSHTLDDPKSPQSPRLEVHFAQVESSGSWDPMKDEGFARRIPAQAASATNKADLIPKLEPTSGDKNKVELLRNHHEAVVENKGQSQENFGETDPFKDIAGWLDAGQGVEVNDSGIPLIGRSSSSASIRSQKEELCSPEPRPFEILGTSAYDVSCHPHVLSPPLMDSLLAFMPEALMECNYWLKYSLVRDGGNLFTMMRQIRASNATVLAIETVDGCVFGAFTNHSWRYSVGWYGGQQAFLWKMRRSRSATTTDILEQAAQESEVQVFPVRPGNVAVQYCSKECLMLGRGEIQMAQQPYGKHGKHYGHGIYLDHSLLHGSTSSTETFGNPCLVDDAERGSRFNVSNIEVWTLTPHDNVADAQQSELSTLFLEGGRKERDLNVLGILVGGTI